MDKATVRVYNDRGADWVAARNARPRQAAAKQLGRRVRRGGVRVDLGAGGGRYTNDLGRPVVALDASSTMLGLLRGAAPGALVVQGDLEALPFRTRSLSGAWANMSYLHIPRPRLPMALAQLHWALEPGAPYDLQVLAGDADLAPMANDDIGGRRFAAWSPEGLADALTGAGFSIEAVESERDVVRARGRRLLSLPDTVGPGLRVLVCGLNPSIYSAERGIGFARPGNRFWAAAVEAGLAPSPFDPLSALRHRGVGMTDMVKRATVASRELSKAEYRDGLARVTRLVARFGPAVVCFVGLEGWRAAVNRTAVAGWQPDGIAGARAYVMPSTSGLNARTSRAELVGHLRRVRAAAKGVAEPAS